jgi:hypothetical protein
VPEYPVLNLAVQRPSLSHCVYQLFNADGILLYVGSSGNLWYRIGQHAAGRPWWPEVAWDRTVVECVSEIACAGRSCRADGHAEMLRYEIRLIRDLSPLHNRLLTGYCRSGRHLLADHGKPDGNGALTCGACKTEYLHQYYVANRAKALASATAYYQANRDEILARKRRRGAAASGAGQQPLPDL